MRIAFWAKACMVAFLITSVAAAKGAVPLDSGGTVGYSVFRGRTRLEIRTATGVRHVLSVERDSTVSPKAAPIRLTIVGEIKETAIILIDAYTSLPGGMSHCQAGEVQFLRILSLAGNPTTETFRVKLESCRENIELASPGIDWNAGSSTLRIRWLQSPARRQEPGELVLRVGVGDDPE